MMRAKMRVVSTKPYGSVGPNGGFEEIEFSAVAKCDGYPVDGSDENNTFAKWTPSATLKMTISNPDLFGKIKPNQEFYVDFTPAD